MRLFIALPIPASVNGTLMAAEKELMRVARGGRYVPKENFHITLHFIGETKLLYEAASSIDEAARGIRPIKLRLDEFGRFKREGNYTAFVKVAGDTKELSRLHETLIGALSEKAFFKLSGGYRRLLAHITLARGLEPNIPDEFGKLRLGAHDEFTADKLVLYESNFTASGMVYTPVHTAFLS